MEPPCKICTRLTPPIAFNSRILENYCKSPVARRGEYCEPRRYNAKVGPDLRSEFDSRFCNVDRVVDKETFRNVQDLDCSKRELKKKIQQKDVLEPLSDAKMIDLKNIHDAVDNCLREMGKIKTFLENENSWWKLLKARDCCQQKLPHLHGILNGSSVTLLLLEERIDQLPRHFIIMRSKKQNDVIDSNVGTSSRELKSERCIDPWKEHTEKYSNTYTVPYYNVNIKSTLIEVASDGHEPTQSHAERTVTSKQSSIASESWTEAQESRSDEEKIPEKETKFDEIQFQDEKTRNDKLNIVPSRETWHDQNPETIFEDRLKPRETFSSENTESKKLAVTAESNVDLNKELSSRNLVNHKPRKKSIIEKGFNHIQKLPTKISKRE